MLVQWVIALGLPVVIGGDWQITVKELAETGVPLMLDASICAGAGATNVDSGRRIDYFVVSNCLLDSGWEVRHIHGTTLATHRPVVLALGRSRCRDRCFSLAQPKVLPVRPVAGPRRQAEIEVSWKEWDAVDKIADWGEYDDELFTNAAQTWYAGAEVELFNVFDIDAGDGDGQKHIGLGTKPTIVEGRQGGRFRHSLDEAGLLGHRLAWTARGLHTTMLLAGKVPQENGDTEADVVRRIGHRAGAFLRDWKKKSRKKGRGGNDGAEDEHKATFEDARRAVEDGLHLLSALIRPVHGRRPILEMLTVGDSGEIRDRFKHVEAQVTGCLSRISAVRRSEELKRLRRWAREATLKVAHRATKGATATTRKTASASKSSR